MRAGRPREHTCSVRHQADSARYAYLTTTLTVARGSTFRSLNRTAPAVTSATEIAITAVTDPL